MRVGPFLTHVTKGKCMSAVERKGLEGEERKATLPTSVLKKCGLKAPFIQLKIRLYWHQMNNYKINVSQSPLLYLTYKYKYLNIWVLVIMRGRGRGFSFGQFMRFPFTHPPNSTPLPFLVPRTPYISILQSFSRPRMSGLTI